MRSALRGLIPTLVLALAVGPLMAPPPAQAQITAPLGMDLQGRLLDDAEQPLTGTPDIGIRIFNHEISSGTLHYEELHTNVPLSDEGVFDLVIGQGIVLEGSFSRETFTYGGTWLEVTVDGEILTPRLQFQSAPYVLGGARVTPEFRSTVSLPVAPYSSIEVPLLPVGLISWCSMENAYLSTGGATCYVRPEVPGVWMATITNSTGIAWTGTCSALCF